MEHRTSVADPVKKRLSMQNEILKRVEELAERMQRRAEEVTREVRELEGRAGAAERDLRSAFDAFRRLSETHFVENVMPEEDQTSCTRDRSKTSVDRNIPAQSYEIDILPRYKEAVLLGLRSYEDHMNRANKRYSTRSTFNPWSVRGPLPHIIGSEEYIHDNSCGLIEDLVFGTTFDFNDIAETKGIQANAETNDLFNSNRFGMEQGPAENKNEPLVSAALDFKAMLEAALRSPYKFYDEESSSHVVEPDDTWTAQPDQVKLLSDNIRTGGPGHLWDVDGSTIPVVGYLSPAEGSGLHTDNISALISGGLFDTEEVSPGCQEQSDNISDFVEGTARGYASVADETGSIGNTTNLPIKRDLGPDNDCREMHHTSVTLSDSNVETVGLEASLEGLDQIEEDIACETHTTIPDVVVEDTKLSTTDDNSVPGTSEESFISKSYPEVLKISAVSQGPREGAKEKISSQLSDDMQRCEIPSCQAIDDSSALTPDCSTGSDGDLKTDI